MKGGFTGALKNAKNPPKEFINTKADNHQEERLKRLENKAKDDDENYLKVIQKPLLRTHRDEKKVFKEDPVQEDVDESIEYEEEEEEDQDKSDLSSDEEIKYAGAWSDDEKSEEEDIKVEKWTKNEFHQKEKQKKKGKLQEEIEEAQEEEKEATKLQSKRISRLKEDDLVDQTIKDMISKQKSKKDKVVSQVNASKDEKLDMILKDSPELTDMITEFNEKFATVKDHILPLLQRVQDRELVTKDGISYLEVKFHLLLNYCIDILFYLLLKASGKKVQDHPVVSQLVELRAIMEKIKPIDERLKYQINKLVTMASSNESVETFDSKPNPDNLAAYEEEGDEDEEVYHAPKLMAVSYDETSQKKSSKSKDRMEKKIKQSEMIKELKNAIGDEPEEEFSIGTEHRKARSKGNELAKDIEDYEMENFKRVSLNKRDKWLLKKSAGSYVDELRELENMNELLDLDKYLKKQEQPTDRVTLLQYLGDVDDAKAQLGIQDEENDQVEEKPKKRKEKRERYDEEENPKKVPKKAVSFTEQKKQRQKEDEILDKEIDKTAHRQASKKILVNRGLTPKRKKEDKNPRVKIRSKFEKKSGPEPTFDGIQKNIVKSKKIKV